MNTRRFALVLLKLMLACFTTLPAIVVAQVATDRFAWVTLSGGGACSEYCYALNPAGISLWASGYEIRLTENPADGAPSWSPDGTRIAFHRAGGIMVIDATGGTPVNITNHPGDGYPAWSSDGTRIAFLSDRDGQPSQLYLMNVDGSGVVRVTNGIPVRGRAAWSPDGSKFVFDCEVEAGNRDICSIKTDGTGFARLTTDPAYEFGPAWSPDGSRIAFSTGRFAVACEWYDDEYHGPVPYELAIMNPDGTGISRVGPAGTPGYSPSWSPDGNRIVFAVPDFYNCSYITSYIHLINTDGTGGAFLRINTDWTSVIVYGSSPAWAPSAPSGPYVALSPLSLGFGAQAVGTTTSYSRATRLFNLGSSELAVSNIVASGDFAQTNTCNGPVAAGATCTISVTFTPTASGTRSGTVTVTDNAPGSPHAVALNGVASISPSASFTSNCIELTCTFNGSASADPDGFIARFRWNYGDGSGGFAPATVNHTYARSDTYTVTLDVFDNVGVVDTESKTVTVKGFMHVGDLDATTSAGQKNTWSATVTVTVEDSSHNPVANAMVTGSWTGGSTSSCTTDLSGRCAVSSSGIFGKKSTTFTVSDVTLANASLFYNSTYNHDPDGDSKGTTITVMRP
jgi:Tol biopolymer transport system component/PKD repeat protein